MKLCPTCCRLPQPGRRLTWLAALTMLLGTNWAAARDVAPEEKMLWSCYMICWPLNRDFHGFYDRPLDRPARDGHPPRLTDLRRAVEAGVDALSVDLFISDKHALPAFGELVKLIREHELPIQLSPMFDGLADPGLTLEDVAAKIEQWFRLFASEPCVVRTGGRPVIFTYGATGLQPAQWRVLWQKLQASECHGYWVGEMSHHLSVGESPNLAGAQPWLELFPSFNSFNVHSRQRAEELNRRQPGKPAWVAPLSMGYWRPEIAVYTSPRGTELFREIWDSITAENIAWVQQSTWNDFGENHHLMPSENRGTAFVELNHYLAKRWKGRAELPAAPRLILSQQQEVLVGEDACWELLAFLPAEPLPATVRLRLLDAGGRCLHTFPETHFTRPGLHAVTQRCPVRERPPGRLLRGEAELDGADGRALARIQGPFTVITAAAYHPGRNFSWLSTAAPSLSAPLSCSLEFSGPENLGARVRVEPAGELADVELLRNGCQFLSLRRDAPGVSLVSPLVWEGKLPVNRKGSLDAGYYTARAVTEDGRMATSPPLFVDLPPEADTLVGDWRFDEDADTDVLDHSPWLHDGRLGGRPRRKPWFPAHAGDPWGGHCLQFDGVDDRVLLEGPVVPPDAFTVECWVKPTPAPAPDGSGQILFATANAAVVLSIDRNGHLLATRKCDGRWRGVRDPSALAGGQWQHVAVTCDGAHLRIFRNGRLAGEETVSGGARCGQVSIGYNSVTDASFYRGYLDELRLSARALTPQEFGPHNPLQGEPGKP